MALGVFALMGGNETFRGDPASYGGIFASLKFRENERLDQESIETCPSEYGNGVLYEVTNPDGTRSPKEYHVYEFSLDARTESEKARDRQEHEERRRQEAEGAPQ